MISQEKIAGMVDDMPAFSSSVTRVMEMTADINCCPRDMVEVIDHDPVMTVKILKLVNSPYFGLRNEIVSIKQAVVILGINTLKNLALTIAAVGMLPKQAIKGFDNKEFLLHSLGVAALARLLSQKIGVPAKESTEYFVAGLLHDFGKVVLVQFLPEEMEQAISLAATEEMDLCDAELETFGSTHTEFGAMLAKKWLLPEPLIISIAEHHSPTAENNDSCMRDCVIAANSLVKKATFGSSGNPHIAGFPQAVSERFGGDLELLAAELGDTVNTELEKIRTIAMV